MATKNYKRYLAELAPKKSEKSAICKDIELKFGTVWATEFKK